MDYNNWSIARVDRDGNILTDSVGSPLCDSAPLRGDQYYFFQDGIRLQDVVGYSANLNYLVLWRHDLNGNRIPDSCHISGFETIHFEPKGKITWEPKFKLLSEVNGTLPLPFNSGDFNGIVQLVGKESDGSIYTETYTLGLRHDWKVSICDFEYDTLKCRHRLAVTFNRITDGLLVADVGTDWFRQGISTTPLGFVTIHLTRTPTGTTGFEPFCWCIINIFPRV